MVVVVTVMVVFSLDVGGRDSNLGDGGDQILAAVVVVVVVVRFWWCWYWWW